MNFGVQKSILKCASGKIQKIESFGLLTKNEFDENWSKINENEIEIIKNGIKGPRCMNKKNDHCN